MRLVSKCVLLALAALVTLGTAFAAPERRDLVVIPQSAQDALIARDIPVTFKASAFFLAEWTEAEQAAMKELGIPFEPIYPGVEDAKPFFLFELHEGEEPPQAWQPLLYRSGLNVIVAMSDDDAYRWVDRGQHAIRLSHEPHGWGTASQRVAYDCTFKPLISEILGKTTQTQYIDWIEKLSGEEPVIIGGSQYTILTRNTATMFSGASHAKGFDFVKQQGQTWGFSGARLEEDPYTASTSGKNLVLTIPGQTTSEVLLTAHLDSTSGSPTQTAPGANDNGTGSATLLEAARLLRQYRFQRTIKLIWFTGEEQFLLGSAAYVADHPTSSVLGDLNLDMFGYDSNGDRCMEIHAGTLPASIDIANCFRDNIGTYSLGLTRDFLTSTATNRSDHASFWNVGVGAIEIAENFFNDNQIGGCVGVDANPGYHTVNDKLATNMHQPFAFSIAKNAIATIAAMAIPVEACFASAPVITATPGNNQIEISWPALPGAAKYRVLRATNGCGGTFAALGETTGTSYIDPLPVFGTFSYKIEAVDADNLCVSLESNCATASPVIYQATPTTVTYTDTCPSGGPGNGNGIIEPGESVVMAVTLRNDADTTLTSIQGTLSSSTPSVTVSDPSAGWPDLGPFTSSPTNPDHFGFSVSTAAVCGDSLALNVQANALQGSWSGSYAPLVGSPGTSSGNFPASDVPKTIFDNQTALSTLNIAGVGNVIDVNVRLSITHSWDGDLDIKLRAPDGTLVLLSDDNGGQGDHYTNTIFDDEALAAITSGAAPFTGTFRPEGLLSAFDGRPAAGAWRLEIFDDTGSDTGTLLSWSLDLTTSSTPICNACVQFTANPGEAGLAAPLTLNKNGSDLELSWGAPATCAPTGYGVFRGDLVALRATGNYAHDVALTCGTTATSYAIPIDDVQLGDAAYFIVVAATDTDEGSYGRSSGGAERPPSGAACKPAQNLSSCP